MFGFVSFRRRAVVLSALAGTVGLSGAQQASAITLDDVTVWTGEESAANRAGLIIEWGDGQSPAVYGYRFDGAATGLNMLEAIIADRPELYGKFGDFSFGRATFGLGLDRDGDGFSVDDGGVITPSSAFVNGSLLLDATQPFDADGGVAADADDSYAEGWNTGFFSYFLADGPTAWSGAPVGSSQRALQDGYWDAYVYHPSFSGPDPSIQVPEPSSAALLGLAGAAMIRRRRNR